MKARIDISGCFNKTHLQKILKLCDNSEDKIYRKYQHLFFENTDAEGIFYIKSGIVKLYKTGYGKSKQIVRFATSGDFAGIKSVILNHQHTISAEALSDLLICFIPKENFQNLLLKNPEVANYLINCLSASIQEIETRNISIVQKTEKERLAEALIYISSKFNSNEINLLKRELVEFTNIEKETLTKYLKLFNKNRLISFNSKRIKILNINGLSHQADMVA